MSGSDPSFSESLRDANLDVWQAMLAHRFVRDVTEDRLPLPVFRRYLVYEHAFVETAVAIFGYALVKAPGIAEQRKLAKVLDALLNDQLDYFPRAFADLGIAKDERRDAALPPAAAGLADGMIGFAAHGGYEEAMTAMLAAEWMYATWCAVAAATPSRVPQIRDWVDLHTAEDFTAQARWLRAEIDRLGPYLPPHRRAGCRRIFRRALELEMEFHAVPYECDVLIQSNGASTKP
jgi:thiaminase (transcriptional activator TenA)